MIYGSNHFAVNYKIKCTKINVLKPLFFILKKNLDLAFLRKKTFFFRHFKKKSNNGDSKKGE